MANRKHVLHIKSNVVNEVDGQKIPKRPLPEDLLEGEIAVNYGAGGELLTIKNSEGNIVGFVNENDFEQLEDTTMAALAGLRQLIDDFTIIVPSNGNLAGHQHNTASLAEGDRALAINDGTKAEGKASFASGDYTTASGFASHTEGSHTIASEVRTHAEGDTTVASGYNSHAEGDHSVASGHNTHAECFHTTASGHDSHSEGNYTTASGGASHAEGRKTTAQGDNSHAENEENTAGGVNSHAGGYQSVANGKRGFAHGYQCEAASENGVALNCATITSNDSETALGRFNKTTANKTAFSIGGGSSKTNRKNLFEIQSDGAILIKNGDTYDVNLQETFSNLKNVTYSELKNLRDNSTLIPGQQYRITDYVTTTTQADTQSANHAFDIIVTATDVNTLNENAKVIKHEGDTYFANANLNAWEIKYTIDNNNEKYQWADKTNGKGVIYYMKDENANECPYDFKNIMFKRWAYSDVQSDELTTEDINKLKSTFVYNSSTQPIHYSHDASTVNGRLPGGTKLIVDAQNSGWYYTFSIVDNGTVKDVSILDLEGYSAFTWQELGVLNNVMLPSYSTGPWLDEPGKVCYVLNNNVFICNAANDFYGFVNNKFDEECRTNTFGNGTNYNIFNAHCSNILMGEQNNHCHFTMYSSYSILGSENSSNYFNESSGNLIIDDCYYNTFGNGCDYNILTTGCDYNIFGSDCNYNVLTTGCDYNTFSNACSYNKIGNNSKHNSFGNNCKYNEIGENCNNNSFGNGCGKKENDVIKKNTIGNNSSNNSFGNNCYDNSLGYQSFENSFGNKCYQNILKNTCMDNAFGNGCYDNVLNGVENSYNTFENGCYSNTLEGYCKNNSFENGCYSNTLEGYCKNNSFGIGCYENHLGESSNRNDLGNVCYLNNFGPSSNRNSFGSGCHHNEFGNIEEEIGTMSKNVLGNGCEYIVFDKDYTENVVVESGNRRITLTTDQTTSNASRLRNIHIALGVNSSSTVKTITHTTVNDEFETRYQSADSITINV